MSYRIPNLTNKQTKSTLICLSSGQIEKIYLEEILKNKNKIDYHNTDSELNQLDFRHKNEEKASKAIDGICDIIKYKLNDQLSFGRQNSDYLLVVITDCDKAPFIAFDKLKKTIKNIISNNNGIKYYFVFSYRGFEDWMQFYYNDGNKLIKNIRKIKKKVNKDIKNGEDIIFNNHKKAVENYYEMTEYRNPVDSYAEIEIKLKTPYSDFPYFFEFLDENYNTEILI